MRRKAFIGVPMAISVRDILRSGVLDRLRAADVEVHLFTRAHDDPAFRSEFGETGVFFHPLKSAPGGTFPLLDAMVLRLYVMILSLRCDTVRIMMEPTLERSVLARAMRGALGLLGHRGTSALVRMARRLTAAVAPDLYRDEILEHRPDVIIGTRVLTMTPPTVDVADRYLDRYLVMSGARHGVRTMVLVASWDNLTTKGFLPTDITRMTVWNDIMRREAIELHDLDPAQVTVTGAPQHDVYVGAPFRTRAQLLGGFGLDPEKPLVLYATQTEGTVPDEPTIVRMVFQAIRDRLGPDVQFLLRAHQLDRASRYAFLEGEPGAAVDHAGSGSLGAYPDRDFDLASMQRLADTLAHADVVLNVASSITIDAAAVGTPAVGIYFDAHPDAPSERSVRRYYEYTHQKNVVRTGALPLAASPAEAAELVERYLKDRDAGREERARLVGDQCYRLDGGSGARVAEAILGELGLHAADATAR